MPKIYEEDEMSFGLYPKGSLRKNNGGDSACRPMIDKPLCAPCECCGEPNSKLCPTFVQYDILQYLNKGQPPGNFLFQLLSNNLKNSFMGADENNRRLMPHIVCFLYNNVPLLAWGSPERVAEVVQAGGFVNYCARAMEKGGL